MTGKSIPIERIQLGVRLEKRLVKVLKAVAELGDMSLTELLEDIVLHAFEGHSTFSDPEVRRQIREIKRIYGADFDAHAGYRFAERAPKKPGSRKTH